MTEIAFNQAPLKTTGGTSSRTLSDWFSDVINVREFESLKVGGSGTMGDATGDDGPCIQRALDLAFHNYGGTPGETPTGVPHGLDYAYLNRPVFIPAGRYIINDPLVLTKVVGGHIFGTGMFSSRITGGLTSLSPFPGQPKPLLHMNGCSHMCIEKMYWERGNLSDGDLRGENSCCIHIDWDEDDSGNGCLGNHHNHFQELQIGQGEYCVVIGRTGEAGSEGRNNTFINCNMMSSGTAGVHVRGPAATNNSMLSCGGGQNATAWVHCPSGGGSIHCEGYDTNNGLQFGVYPPDFLIESDYSMIIGTGRSESQRILRQEAGIVTIMGICGTGQQNVMIELNGGKCLLMGNDFHDGTFSGTNCQITGTGGELYLFANSFFGVTSALSGYSGDIVMDPDNIEGL